VGVAITMSSWGMYRHIIGAYKNSDDNVYCILYLYFSIILYITYYILLNINNRARKLNFLAFTVHSHPEADNYTITIPIDINLVSHKMVDFNLANRFSKSLSNRRIITAENHAIDFNPFEVVG